MSEENNTEALAENLTSLTPAMDLDQIIAEINKPYDGIVPVVAICQIQANRELFIPKLIELLRNQTEKIKHEQELTSNVAVIAMLLCAEFEAKAALPAIVEAISLPEDGAYELFGDLITESLCVTLAALVDEPFDVLEALIKNPAIDEFVRSAAMSAYLCLFKLGRITRDEVIKRFHKHLLTAIETKDEELATTLVPVMSDLCPSECLDDIKSAYVLGLVDPFIIRFEDVEQDIANGLQEKLGSIAHLDQLTPPETVTELSSWYSNPEDHDLFDEEDYDTSDDLEDYLDDEFEDENEPRIGISSDWNFRADQPEPIARPHREESAKVGRNDPCPCGSGKKFKKCCGSRVSS